MSSASAHPSTAKAPTAGGGKSTSTTPGKPAEPEPSPVSYFGLWRFATWLDVLFAVLGVIAGVGNGVVFPLFTLVRSRRHAPGALVGASRRLPTRRIPPPSWRRASWGRIPALGHPPAASSRPLSA